MDPIHFPAKDVTLFASQCRYGNKKGGNASEKGTEGKNCYLADADKLNNAGFENVKKCLCTCPLRKEIKSTHLLVLKDTYKMHLGRDTAFNIFFYVNIFFKKPQEQL